MGRFNLFALNQLLKARRIANDRLRFAEMHGHHGLIEERKEALRDLDRRIEFRRAKEALGLTKDTK